MSKPTVWPDYIYIQAWGKLMGQFANQIEASVNMARREKAPETAIYRDSFTRPPRWVLLEELKNVDAKSRTKMWANHVKEEIAKQYGDSQPATEKRPVVRTRKLKD